MTHKRKSPRSKNSKAIIAGRMKEAQAIELRVKGFTLEAIAEQLGYADHTGARQAIMRALERMVDKEDLEKYRGVQLTRYERLWQKHYEDWESAASPEARAFAYQCLDRIANRIERVTGLARDIEMNFNTNNVQVNSYTVVEENGKPGAFIDADEFKQPMRQVQEYRNGNGVNGNGANGHSHE